MRCQNCGNEAYIEQGRTLREELGPEATVTLTLQTVTTHVCDSCATRLTGSGWALLAISKRTRVVTKVSQPTKPIIPIIVKTPVRCAGCRWHTPQKFGGEGFICSQKNGKCPEWAIKWAINYTKNGHGKSIKSFMSDEALLEALRL